MQYPPTFRYAAAMRSDPCARRRTDPHARACAGALSLPKAILDRHFVAREWAHSCALCDVQIVKRRALQCGVLWSEQRRHWVIRGM